MDHNTITPNTSDPQLAVNGDNESATSLLQEKSSRRRENLSEVTYGEFMTVGILCFINLINYMDRFTLAGVLDHVKDSFDIDDSRAGLLQTVFVVAYMVFAPMFGYLGDRYSRRHIMAFGVALWCLTTFAGSFVPTYGPFLVFRGLVGIGEASYSTIAPTIISDLFVGNIRSKMLAFFYFAIPVGSGLGYIVGSAATEASGNWRWGLRVTPVLGAVAVALIMFLLQNPERGQAENSQMKSTSYKEDIIYLLKNPSFMLSTLAFTCVAFVSGALAWWGPQFIYNGFAQHPESKVTIERVSLIFGVITMVAGVLGVPMGAWLGTSLLKRWPRAHPCICGLGLLVSAPAFAAAILLCEYYYYTTLVLVFVGQLALNLNWAIVVDISLYVVVPPKRSSAEAFQILISHMFGDAGSPYLIGVISDSLKYKFSPGQEPSKHVIFRALQYALFSTCFVEILGGIFFFLTAIYILKDKSKVEKAIEDAEVQHAEPSHSNANIEDELPSTTNEEANSS